ncbi:MAG: TetR/AcrR family transcriptional regulator [Bacilli bacterium]
MTKKEQTMANIMGVSISLFGKHGYDKTSTNEIAKMASISKGLIFKYYSSKTALYYACLDQVVTDMLMDVDSLHYVEKDSISRISEMVIWKTKYFQTHPQSMQMILEALQKFPEVIETLVHKHPTLIKSLWVEPLFQELDDSTLDPRYTKQDFIRFVMYAIEGMQSTMIKQGITSTACEYLKEDIITFIKIIKKGMEKNHESNF